MINSSSLSIVDYRLLALVFGVMLFSISITNLASADWIDIQDNIVRKKGSSNTIEINGHVSTTRANMTVIYPDNTVKNSQLKVTKQGVINPFIVISDKLPSGLYTVQVHSYNDTNFRDSKLTSYFFLGDYDGLLHLDIKRNAAIGCETSGINISDECLSPTYTKIPLTFGMRFWNDDYRTHQMSIGAANTGIILPNGDGIVFPTRSGEIDYRCLIHPWIGGHVDIVRVSTLQYRTAELTSPNVTSTIAGTISDIPSDHTDGVDIVQYTYDTSCSMCWTGIVTEIEDGDTLYVDEKYVRLALTDTPNEGRDNYDTATAHTSRTCPVGMRVLVDPDDNQPTDKFGRTIAMVTCGDILLNESLYTAGLAQVYDFSCNDSEFADETWLDDECPKEEPPTEVSTIITNTINATTNDTLEDNISNIITNSTNNTAIISAVENNMELIFISILALVIVIAICLVVIMKRMNSSTKTVDTFEFLE